jgi:hypothetical protein
MHSASSCDESSFGLAPTFATKSIFKIQVKPGFLRKKAIETVNHVADKSIYL